MEINGSGFGERSLSGNEMCERYARLITGYKSESVRERERDRETRGKLEKEEEWREGAKKKRINSGREGGIAFWSTCIF